MFPDKIVDLDMRGEYGYACDVAFDVYQELIDNGVPKEDARMVLPIGTTTKLIATANFRQWMHVIELRCNKASQWEIRAVCTQILELLYKQAPNVFQDLAERFLDVP